MVGSESKIMVDFNFLFYAFLNFLKKKKLQKTWYYLFSFSFFNLFISVPLPPFSSLLFPLPSNLLKVESTLYTATFSNFPFAPQPTVIWPQPHPPTERALPKVTNDLLIVKLNDLFELWVATDTISQLLTSKTLLPLILHDHSLLVFLLLLKPFFLVFFTDFSSSAYSSNSLFSSIIHRSGWYTVVFSMSHRKMGKTSTVEFFNNLNLFNYKRTALYSEIIHSLFFWCQNILFFRMMVIVDFILFL